MRIKDKRGISNIIGYIVLISIVIVMSVIVFQWLRTYVPTDSIDCPEGVGTSAEDLRYYCDDKKLNFSLKNTGRFNIAGYFIHATTSPTQEIAIEDLSQYLNASSLGSIIFLDGSNSLKPNNKISNTFNLSSSGISRIYSIELIPIRYQKQNNRDLIVSCTNARIDQPFGCFENVTSPGGGVCTPNTCSGLNYTCGSWSDGCSGTLNCGTCNVGDICSSGQCVPGQPVCGNGIVESGEQCDDGNSNSGDGCSNSCQIESGYICSGQPSSCINEIITFVSSQTSDGNFNGISGADTICNNLASSAGLNGTFAAWLSNNTLNAKDRIPPAISGFPFIRTDGVKVADNLNDLIDGSIDNKINVDESGSGGVTNQIWTGTDKSGINIENKNCNNWISASSPDKGERGKADKTDKKWTEEGDSACQDTNKRLYCFQIS